MIDGRLSIRHKHYYNSNEPKLKGTARNMGKNDLWIAATGSVLKLVLITTDDDFDHLDGHFLEINKVSLNDYKN